MKTLDVAHCVCIEHRVQETKKHETKSNKNAFKQVEFFPMQLQTVCFFLYQNPETERWKNSHY